MISAASIIAVGVLPILVGLYAKRFGIDLRGAGWLMTAQSAGTGLGTAAAFWLFPRGYWRATVAVSLGVAAIGAVAAAYAPGYAVLLLCVAVSGCGAGIAYSFVIAILGRSTQPERVFAGAVIAQGSGFALYAMLLSEFEERLGAAPALASVALWYLLAAGLAVLLPQTAAVQADHSSSVAGGEGGTPALLSFSGAASLAGLLCFMIGIFAFWGYVERIGANAGLGAAAIGNGITLGLVAGIAAAVVPVAAGARFGRVRMVMVACGCIFAGLALLAEPRLPASFFAGNIVFNIGWSLGVAYLMGLIAYWDHAGPAVRLIPLAQVMSGMIGPAIVAAAIGKNTLVVNEISAAFCVAAVLLVLIGRWGMTGRVSPGVAGSGGL